MYKMFFDLFQTMSQEERTIWLIHFYECACCPLASMKPEQFSKALEQKG